MKPRRKREGKTMPNMLDYLEWRGDLTLEQSPFCQVGNLILSHLASVPLDGVVGVGCDQTVRLAEAAAVAYTYLRAPETKANTV